MLLWFHFWYPSTFWETTLCLISLIRLLNSCKIVESQKILGKMKHCQIKFSFFKAELHWEPKQTAFTRRSSRSFGLGSGSVIKGTHTAWAHKTWTWWSFGGTLTHVWDSNCKDEGIEIVSTLATFYNFCTCINSCYAWCHSFFRIFFTSLWQAKQISRQAWKHMQRTDSQFFGH